MATFSLADNHLFNPKKSFIKHKESHEGSTSVKAYVPTNFLLHGGLIESNGLKADESGSEDDNDDPVIQISGVPFHIPYLNGSYFKTDWDLNGKPHYEKDCQNNTNGDKIHLYWTGTQWVLHYDLDPSRNFENLLAYAKSKSTNLKRTSSLWIVKSGNSYEPTPSLTVSDPTLHVDDDSETNSKDEVEEFMGIPRKLFPSYLSFMFDAIATGLVMPLLPFYVMDLGADAMQLSLVVSANYIAQTIGCILMGKVSDVYGRKFVLICCLLASSCSYFCISKANSLFSVALARIICGSFGGMIPVMQSCVADSSSLFERPKYLGRIMATFGLGFVLGPALSAILPGLNTRNKIQLAALLPFTGFLITLFFGRETKKNTRGIFGMNKLFGSKSSNKHIQVIVPKVISKEASNPVSPEVLMLVLNGFLIMYAFSTETIYAMFMKDSFGYGERVLSGLFAINGLFIGIFQVFLIKPMINMIGKHVTLAMGNLILAFGMVGVALIREEAIHFSLFAIHMIGYSIADTSLASLISRYSSPSSQGRDLALNQAAQSCARVFSPLLAGMLYELSKNRGGFLPSGALPFLVGAMCPALAVTIPSLLFIRSLTKKRTDSAKDSSMMGLSKRDSNVDLQKEEESRDIEELSRENSSLFNIIRRYRSMSGHSHKVGGQSNSNKYSASSRKNNLDTKQRNKSERNDYIDYDNEKLPLDDDDDQNDGNKNIKI